MVTDDTLQQCGIGTEKTPTVGCGNALSVSSAK
jgi:hypothetical protein